MSGRDALALFAGLGAGYMQGEQQKRQQARQDKVDAYQEEIQGRDRDAYNLAQETRQKLADAAQTVTPQGDASSASTGVDPTVTPSAVPISSGSGFGGVGSDASAQPAPVATRYSVGDQSGLNADDAAKAAATANSPTAQMGRMANVLGQSGDAAGAATMRQQARQAQLADIQLGAAQRQDIAEKFNTDMNSRVRSFDDLGNFVSESNGDGQGGALKVKPVKSADGKTVTMSRIDPDGTLTPLPNYTFPNTEDGLTQAKTGLLQGMSTEQQLVHLHQSHQDKVAQQNADTQEQYRKDQTKNTADKIAMMETIQELKNDAKSAGGGLKLPPGVAIEYQDAAKRSEGLQTTIDKARADGTWDDSKLTPGQNAMLTQQAVLEKKKSDILGKYGYGSRAAAAGPLGVYDPNNPGAAAAPAPARALSPVAAAVAAAPPGSWVNPNMPRPPVLGTAPAGLAMMNPQLVVARAEQAKREADAAQATAAWQKVIQNGNRTQMTH